MIPATYNETKKKKLKNGKEKKKENGKTNLAEGDAGAGAESGEAGALGPAGAPEDEDVDGDAGQGGDDDEQHGHDDVGRRGALGRRRSAQHVRLTVDAFKVGRADAVRPAVVGARAAVLARTAQRRRTRPLLHGVARRLGRRRRRRRRRGTGRRRRAVRTHAPEAARNLQAQVRARAVAARVAHRRVVAVLAEHCARQKQNKIIPKNPLVPSVNQLNGFHCVIPETDFLDHGETIIRVS